MGQEVICPACGQKFYQNSFDTICSDCVKKQEIEILIQKCERLGIGVYQFAMGCKHTGLLSPSWFLIRATGGGAWLAICKIDGEQITCPGGFARHVIGKGGEKIKSLALKLGVKYLRVIEDKNAPNHIGAK